MYLPVYFYSKRDPAGIIVTGLDDRMDKLDTGQAIFHIGEIKFTRRNGTAGLDLQNGIRNILINVGKSHGQALRMSGRQTADTGSCPSFARLTSGL